MPDGQHAVTSRPITIDGTLLISSRTNTRHESRTSGREPSQVRGLLPGRSTRLKKQTDRILDSFGERGQPLSCECAIDGSMVC